MIIILTVIMSLTASCVSASLLNMLQSHNGLFCSFWEHHLIEFESLFQFSSKKTFLNIGIRDEGGCLELFSKSVKTTKAIDIIGSGCEKLVFNGDTNILVACVETLTQANFFTDGDLFGVVTDSLLLTGADSISILMSYLRKVEPGHFYVIENIDRSYKLNVNGESGVGIGTSAIGQLKNIVEMIHFYYIDDFKNQFHKLSEGEQYFVRWIDSIKFLDNMVVIRKLSKQRMSEWIVCIAGSYAYVSTVFLQHAIKTGQFQNTINMEDISPEEYLLLQQIRESSTELGRASSVTVDGSSADDGAATNTSTASLPSLMKIFKEHEGHMSVKWVHYLYEYNRLFNPFRGVPVTFLEIGVQNGGSQQIWRKFFGPLSSVYGADIDPKVCDLQLGEGITLYCLDASNATEAAPLLARQYDLIVDDASHINALVIRSFEMLFPLVKPGGIYVVEDVHTSYSPVYHGGLVLTNMTEYFKRLVDLINFWHVEDEEWKAGLSEFQQYCRDWVKTVRFLDGMIILEKRDTIRTGPYKRISSIRDSL